MSDTQPLPAQAVIAPPGARGDALLWTALLVAFASWLVARGARQSITHDEALTCLLFVEKSWHYVLTTYNSNHHILHTLLVKLSTAAFGVSELTLRIPSIAGGVLYAAGCARLSRRLFPGRVPALTAFAILALNPYVADFLVASRGYALALAFFVWHLEALLAGRLTRGAVLAGLAVSANLTFLFGVLATSGARLLLHRERPIGDALRLSLPAIAVGALICAGPLMNAQRAHFYTGTTSLLETGMGMLSASFRHGARDLLPWAAPALIAALGTALWSVTKRISVASFFLAASLLALALTIVANLIFDTPFPSPRTGLYLLLLLTFFLITGLRAFSSRAVCLPPIAIAAMFAAQFQWSYFHEWRYDAATRRLFEIAAAAPARREPARICADWEYEPSLNFYRSRRTGHRFEPVVRGVADQCDFALLNEQPLLGNRHDDVFSQNALVELARDPFSRTILYAARGDASAQSRRTASATQ